MIEIWKPIQGYEKRYRISNLGNVWSNHTNKIMSPNTTRKGYKTISLSNGSVSKTYSIHRLVAFHFRKGYAKGLEVNHIDANSGNNVSSNLEWVTRQENRQHAKAAGLLTGYTDANRRGIELLILHRGESTYYPSILRAVRETNLSRRIIECLLANPDKHYRGIKAYPKPLSAEIKPVVVIHPNGVTEKFLNMSSAMKSYKITRGMIAKDKKHSKYLRVYL